MGGLCQAIDLWISIHLNPSSFYCIAQHGCLYVLGKTIQQNPINHIVEADIKSFFDKVNHDWLIKFLQLRIGDSRILRLIGRMLKGGMMEDGLIKATEAGTPQGSIPVAIAVQYLLALCPGPMVQW